LRELRCYEFMASVYARCGRYPGTTTVPAAA
jgi:hypothetical protein